ncbi:hypothetical protein [Massilia sp. TSP1-1-2]|uniref:hypothetical protein n=1 Tax=Massilia sp. TSP1-1-2 TaxID=2804649 RepID=UPI003CF9913A
MKALLMLPATIALLLAQPAFAAAPACPSDKFEPFFKAYAESAAVQKAFTEYPLAHVLLDHSAEKPRAIKVALPQAKLSFPLLPSAAKRKADHLAFRVDAITADKAQATIFNTERGYQKAYFFRKSACWKLELIEDRSL